VGTTLTRGATHWKASECPAEGWVWSAATASTHFERSTLKEAAPKCSTAGARFGHLFCTAFGTRFSLDLANSAALPGLLPALQATAQLLCRRATFIQVRMLFSRQLRG
jgi:hypothetical protein